jgi:uncharacterized protein YjbI with pentapeptide repeats
VSEVELDHDFELDDVELEGDDWSSAEAEDGSFTCCRLQRVNLTASKLMGVRMRDVLLKSSEASNAEWRRMVGLRLAFEECGLVGFDLAEGRLEDVTFQGCKLDYANFRFLKAQKVVFRECSMVEADFQDSELTSVDFIGCDLTKSRFVRSKLKSVDLRTSNLDDIEKPADLNGATVDTGQLIGMAARLAAQIGIVVNDGPDEDDDAEDEAVEPQPPRF